MVWLLVFLLLQVADFATTFIAFKLGGSEQNPLILGFIGAFGQQGLLIAKVVVIIGGTVLALASKYRALRIASIVFVGVVLWNVVAIVRLAGLVGK